MNEPISIDPEFRQLIPPLSEEEYKQLEENCRKDGIRDPLVTWKGILIDGHNRYKISEEWDLNYRTEEIDFKNREEALRWIILNQFGRRNLSAYDRSVLALKLKPIIAEKAKENLSTHTEQGYQKSDKAVSTTKELAKVAGVSHDTIHKVETIEAKATPRTKELVRQGKLSINQAYNSTREKEPDPVKQAKEEHLEFEQKKESKTVSIQDVQKDKLNKQIVNRALLIDVQKLLNAIDKFGLSHTTKDLACLSSMVDDDECFIFTEICETCQKILEKIKAGFKGEIK